MKTKLLQKTQHIFLLYSGVILLVAAPIFYFSIEKLYLQEADDTLILRKKEFELQHSKSLKSTEIKAWNDYNRDAKIEVANTSLASDTFFTKSFYDKIDNENEPYRVLNSLVIIDGQDYIFSTRINLVEQEDLIASIALLFIAILLLLLLGIYFITKTASKSLWQPFYQTLQKLEGYDIDKDNSIKFHETTIEEFDRLNITVEKLIARNNLIFTSQKEFIENAAHEMQTPLAVFKSKMELLQQQPELTDNQYEILEQLNESISRLTKLNKNLLLLSRVENQQYNDLETVEWRQVLTKLFSFYKEQAEVKNITIDLKIVENRSSKANAVLVEILVSNLLLNAIKHNHSNGTITVDLYENKLVFSNSGKEKSLEDNTLFERFSKSNPSKAGTGLGLAIVKKICEQNHWHIQYSFGNKLHFFTLHF